MTRHKKTVTTAHQQEVGLQAAAAHAAAWMEFEDFDYYLDPYTTLIVHGAYGFVTGEAMSNTGIPASNSLCAG